MQAIKVRNSHGAGCDCAAEDCPTSGGVFYVVAARGKEVFELVGPLPTFREALDVMPQAWLFFWKLNPKTQYRWHITKHFDEPPHIPGLLNDQLGLAAARTGERPE